MEPQKSIDCSLSSSLNQYENLSGIYNKCMMSVISEQNSSQNNSYALQKVGAPNYKEGSG